MGIVEALLTPFAKKYGKHIVLDGRYAARAENTVAATVARSCGVAALQIELSTLLRYLGGIMGRTPRSEVNPFPGIRLVDKLPAPQDAARGQVAHVLG